MRFRPTLLAVVLTAVPMFFGPLGVVRADDDGEPLEPLLISSGDIYDGYTSWTYRGNHDGDQGIGMLFVPVWQDDGQIIFADVRGQVQTGEEYESNWGVGMRQIIGGDWIFGINSYYDIRATEHDHKFDRFSVGAEAMSVKWEGRINYYVGDSRGKAVGPPVPTAMIDNGTVSIVHPGEERLYDGVDGEVGMLLADFDRDDVELRQFFGGYYYDTEAPDILMPPQGFPTIRGWRTRTELRLYDLKLLGTGSRIVGAFEYRNDSIRDHEVAGLVHVRIALGQSNGNCPLPRLQRRMLDRVVRDTNMVTHVQGGFSEPAIDDKTGNLFGPTSVVNAATFVPAHLNVGANSTLIADGSQGDINTVSPFLLGDGSNLIGGGSVIPVTGSLTGTMVDFIAPGSQPTINGLNAGQNVVEIASNTSVRNVIITGGRNGIYGVGVSGICIVGNDISGANFDGIQLLDSNSGDITDNILNNNGRAGLLANNWVGGTISGNTANNNVMGMSFNRLTSGTISGNTASNNFGNPGPGAGGGLWFGEIFGGTVSGNTANGNALGGIYVAGQMTGGTISGNTANNNVELAGAGPGDGISVVGALTGGTISNNRADTNQRDGVYLASMTGGTVSGNVADGNRRNGYTVTTLDNGSITGNRATRSVVDGFNIGTMNGGSVTGNTAGTGPVNGNNGNGFTVATLNGGTFGGAGAAGNTADGNAADGFNIASLVNGTVEGNQAFRNAANGFNIGTATGGSLVGNIAGNPSADGNGADGFAIMTVAGTDITANSAGNNGAHGFDVGTVNAGASFGPAGPFDRTTANTALNNALNDFNIQTVSGTVNGNSSGIQPGGTTPAMASTAQNGFAIETLNNGATVSNNMVNGSTMNGFVLPTVVAGATVDTNAVMNSAGNGFLIDTVAGGTVSNNTATMNAGDGFQVFSGAGISDGNVRFNTATENRMNGFNILAGIGAPATLEVNTANDNLGGDGFNIGGTVSGTVAQNTANGNSAAGFKLDSIAGGALVSDNTASNNMSDGFEVTGTSSGAFANNAANNNASHGFRINAADSGTIDFNSAVGNAVGMQVTTLSGTGFVFNNTSNQNGDGFIFTSIVGGSVDSNDANNNTANGFNVNNMSAGAVRNNVASGNAGSGYNFTTTFSGGVVEDNVASGNSVHGFDIFSLTGAAGTLLDDNSALNNGAAGVGDGILIRTLGGGTVSNNLADGNVDDGFDFDVWANGDVNNNVSTNNGDMGFEFPFVHGGSAALNAAAGNGGGNGVP